jgi:riboflavin synthase
MFTGIIEDIGKVVSFNNQQLTFLTKLDNLHIGDSIAVNGVCLTIIDYKLLNKKNTGDKFVLYQVTVEVSKETLARTNVKNLKINSMINLERALKLNSPLGGHIVLGHIDTTVKIKNIKKEAGNEKNLIMTFELPKNLAKYVVEKGSVAIDGISLTVAKVDKEDFSVVLIPHTLKSTTLQYKKVGDSVNFEADVLAKYIENMISNYLNPRNQKLDKNDNIFFNETNLLQKLKENGFL